MLSGCFCFMNLYNMQLISVDISLESIMVDLQFFLQTFSAKTENFVTKERDLTFRVRVN